MIDVWKLFPAAYVHDSAGALVFVSKNVTTSDVTTGEPSFNCAPTQFHHQCPCFHIINDMLECYLRVSNHQPFDYWRAHHVYYVASQPRTNDRLISHLESASYWHMTTGDVVYSLRFSLIKSPVDSGRI